MQDENERQWRKSERENVRHFLQKTCNYDPVYVEVGEPQVGEVTRLGGVTLLSI